MCSSLQNNCVIVQNRAKQVALTHMKFDGVMRTQNAFDFDIVSSLKKLFQDYCLYIYIYESCEGAILCGIDNLKASLHYFLW